VLLESPPHTGEMHFGVEVQLARSWNCSLWEDPIWEFNTMTNQSLPFVEVTFSAGLVLPNWDCT
jgi:hypothetical protein